MTPKDYFRLCELAGMISGEAFFSKKPRRDVLAKVADEIMDILQRNTDGVIAEVKEGE